MAAIQTAASVPVEVRNKVDLGKIVLTAAGEWLSPDAERFFLPDKALNSGDIDDGASCVHPKLASDPDTRSALKMLIHEKADKIKAAFDLAEPTPEIHGEDDPIPLTDVWPGLKQYLPSHQTTCRLIRCERIVIVGQDRPCVFHSANVYLADTVGDDERRKLQCVAKELNLGLSSSLLDRILHRKTPREVEERRAAIRQCPTDVRRLLTAVGAPAYAKTFPDR